MYAGDTISQGNNALVEEESSKGDLRETRLSRKASGDQKRSGQFSMVVRPRRFCPKF